MPSGLQRSDKEPKKASGLLTCSITSIETTKSYFFLNCSICSSAVECKYYMVRDGSNFAWFLAYSYDWYVASKAVTFPPSRYRLSERRPPPHPTSIIDKF